MRTKNSSVVAPGTGAFAVAIALWLTGCCCKGPPALPSDPATVPPLPESRAELPLRLDLEKLVEQLNEELPHHEEFWEAWIMDGDHGYKYMWRRTDLGFHFEQNQVIISCAVHFDWKTCQLVHNWHMETGGDSEDFGLNIASDIHWNNDWTLSSRSQVRGYVPDLFRSKINDVLTKLDSRIANITQGASQLVPDVWTNASTPIQISQAPPAWLSLNPTDAYATPVDSVGTSIVTSVGVVARPTITIGGEPSHLTPHLPPVKTQHGHIGDIRVDFDANISYDEANRELAQLKGRKYTSWKGFTISPALARRYHFSTKSLKDARVSFPGYFIVDDVNITGSSNVALLTVKVHGIPFSGTIYFEGTLNYDNQTYELSVENLEYRTASNDLFLLIADWALHGKFLADLRSRCQWNLSQDITDTKDRLEMGFSKALKKYALDVKAMVPQAIYATNKGFVTTVQFRGDIDPVEGYPRTFEGHKIAYFLTFSDVSQPANVPYAAIFKDDAFVTAPGGEWTQKYRVSFMAVENQTGQKMFFRIRADNRFDVADDANFVSNVKITDSVTYVDWYKNIRQASVADFKRVYSMNAAAKVRHPPKKAARF